MNADIQTRKPLERSLRRKLESTVIKAREVAEQAAAQALNRLSVGDSAPEDYLDESQRKLRNRLRAHGRQLGDIRQANGEQTIKKLVTEVAYEHWHRMLFARFLEQNQLLMYDDHTNVTLADCDELVKDGVFQDDMEAECTNGWELAAVLASKMLPQIFRIDSPVFELQFAPEHQRKLEQLVVGLAQETFQAQDSLGWVYQFWQTQRKTEVNASEVKIGADELAPVTQLFTEDYMVSFLLDNSLGAWWASQRLTDDDWSNAQSEQELRDKAAIPGVPLNYLRFVKKENEKWTPASGTFAAWPEQMSELKTLDPCCGSGHFLVAAFLMLVPMRMEMEALDAKTAVDRVLSENLHGLELDQRCVELAAFALALSAWKYPFSGGYRQLPRLNVACSGVWVSSNKAEWQAVAKDDTKLEIALEELYQQFKDAPVLGSLINPHASLNRGSLFELKWQEIGPLLRKALATELDDEKYEMGVAAEGLVATAEILARQYDLLITNPPYLGEKKQHSVLRAHIQDYFRVGKADLATSFVLRGEEFVSTGTQCLVLPQNWLYQKSYEVFRRNLLSQKRLRLLNQLGGSAFENAVGADVLLLVVSAGDEYMYGLDLTGFPGASLKSDYSQSEPLNVLSSKELLSFSDARIILSERDTSVGLLEEYAKAVAGINNGDNYRFTRQFWEASIWNNDWSLQQTTSNTKYMYDGMSLVFKWCGGGGEYGEYVDSLQGRLGGSWRRGHSIWEKKGVAISQMGDLVPSLYSGNLFDQSVAIIAPHSCEDIDAIWAFCSSEEFNREVRKIDKKKNVTNATLVKVPFDVDKWKKISEEKFPYGLPLPYTDDPTQWIFHGHPCGSVVWNDDQKWTSEALLRTDDSVLQIAVARLLGYRWPAELDQDMELAEEQRVWVQRCQDLAGHVDDDGIVCLPAVRGEKSADQRLEALLQDAYGSEWTIPLKNRLLETVGSKSLTFWLRDKFFEQHCKLFQHRPFIWHVWDGLKDGFSVLVNYHKLNKTGLERLIYTYLGDWIRTQQTAVADGEDGADVRLAAAQTLKKELEAILEGEAPYDIFVRWKPLEKQPIGWNPDLNDGVRLNIRPFMKAKDLGKKGAGILRAKPNIHWNKDRGKDVPSAPWYSLGLQYGEKEDARINDHHLSIEEKKKARSDGSDS